MHERGGRPVSTAWDPTAYLAFGDHRARPFHDLLARIASRHPRLVVDLGCGAGNLTALLVARWPDAAIEALDSSAEMVGAARARGIDAHRADVVDWAPAPDTDVVITNAVLQWVPQHRELLPRWLAALPVGAELAVQVPGNFRAPTHALLAELCALPRWADRVGDAAPRPDAVLEPAGYLDVLTGAGLAADVWETTYLHVLTGEDPVLAWVRGTVLRPVLARLGEDDAAELTEAYAAALRAAYPRRPDGTTVLPFRRVFAVGRRVS